MNIDTLNFKWTAAGDLRRSLAISSRRRIWSSLEHNGNNAWQFHMSAAPSANNNNKENSYRVRPVVALGEGVLESWIEARDKCYRNKYSSSECERFRMDEDREILDLAAEVESRTYRPSRSKCLIVTHPRPREIFAAAFRDRVVQTWAVMRLEPLFDELYRQSGDASFNCRVGYGQHHALKRLYESVKTKTGGWTRRDVVAAKFDIRAFFLSIDRPLLGRLLREFVDSRYQGADKETLLWLCDTLCRHTPCNDFGWATDPSLRRLLPPGKSLLEHPEWQGMAAGNIFSQHAANFYLAAFDGAMVRLTKRMDCAYVRFVDDFAFVGDKPSVLHCRDVARRWLSLYRHLQLHPDKQHVQKAGHGIAYLGGVLKPHRIYLNNRSAASMERCMRRLASLCDVLAATPDDRIAMEQLRLLAHLCDSLNSLLGLASHYSTFRLRRRLYTPYLARIRRVCAVNSDMLYARPHKKYSLFNLIRIHEDNQLQLRTA